MIDNKDKVALIFGVRNDASICWAVAQALHASGCRVAISYLPDTKDELHYLMDNAGMDKELTLEVDIRDEQQITDFVQMVFARTGRIDFVLHGTAYANHRLLCTKPPGTNDEPAKFLDIDLESLQESIDVSAYSLIRLCRVVAPFLKKGASILTLTFYGSGGVISSYAGMSISKAALECIMRHLAFNFGDAGIRVNALSPGLVITTSAAAMQSMRRMRKLSREVSPLGNIKADAVANAALYYFSDLSEGVTGNIHFVDGGINIMIAK